MHVVSDERLGEPRTDREVFELLAKSGWVPRELGETLGRMAGLRNILVHGYEVVDPVILREVVEHELDGLLAFAGAIRRRLDR